eukprot:1470708-Amphidinium_carterae.1
MSPRPALSWFQILITRKKDGERNVLNDTFVAGVEEVDDHHPHQDLEATLAAEEARPSGL